jgi:hypothetical protein
LLKLTTSGHQPQEAKSVSQASKINIKGDFPIMIWSKLAIILVLATAIVAIPMTSAMAAWGPTGVYVDNTTAGFQMLNSNAQNAAWVLGYGNRPGFQAPEEQVTCYLNEGARMAAAALGNQQKDVPVLFQNPQ